MLGGAILTTTYIGNPLPRRVIRVKLKYKTNNVDTKKVLYLFIQLKRQV